MRSIAARHMFAGGASLIASLTVYIPCRNHYLS